MSSLANINSGGCEFTELNRTMNTDMELLDQITCKDSFAMNAGIKWAVPVLFVVFLAVAVAYYLIRKR